MEGGKREEGREESGGRDEAEREENGNTLYTRSERTNVIIILYIYIYICHPLPSNSQQETTNSMSHDTVVAGLLLTLDHYQPQISLNFHIKYCTLDDKIVA